MNTRYIIIQNDERGPMTAQQSFSDAATNEPIQIQSSFSTATSGQESRAARANGTTAKSEAISDEHDEAPPLGRESSAVNAGE